MLEEKANEYAKVHMNACEKWKQGDIDNCWLDDSGYICIRYQSGEWWHYRVNGAGELEWW